MGTDPYKTYARKFFILYVAILAVICILSAAIAFFYKAESIRQAAYPGACLFLVMGMMTLRRRGYRQLYFLSLTLMRATLLFTAIITFRFAVASSLGKINGFDVAMTWCTALIGADGFFEVLVGWASAIKGVVKYKGQARPDVNQVR